MVFVLMILLIKGSAVLVFWNLLMFKANPEHEMEVAHYAYRNYKEKQQELMDKYNVDKAYLEELSGFASFWRKLWHNPMTSYKKITKLQKSVDKLDNSNFNGINFLVLPGYAALGFFNITGDNKFFERAVVMYSNLKGREYAIQNTRYLMAAMLSCVIGGIGATMVAGVLMVGNGSDSMGLALAIIGPLIAIVLAFTLFDGVKNKSKQRNNEIMLDFAQAVTELALLTSSGMEMFRAWNAVCCRPERTGALFNEMRQTTAEIDNGVQPSIAIDGFIKRCGTKPTSRLGASILQNLTRGNDELSRFLEELSKDVWEERKHDARRLGEQAKSKLMLPMGLIFLGILIIVGAAVVVGMGAMDM